MPLVALRRLFAAIVPNSVTIALSLFEISFVRVAICPQVLTKALRHSVYILASIVVSVAVVLFSLAVFESIFEESSVAVSVDFVMNAFAIR